MAGLFHVDVKKPMDGDEKYSRAIKVPQYEPKNRKPELPELLDTNRYTKLMKHINESNVSEEEKKFLKYGATRHIVFNYGLIADYYAHASKEMQELMEESALVIIDIDDAIANGYINLSDRMKQLIDEAKQREGFMNEPEE